jgi:hypothetical protein
LLFLFITVTARCGLLALLCATMRWTCEQHRFGREQEISAQAMELRIKEDTNKKHW